MADDEDPLAAVLAATEARQREAAGIDPDAATLFAVEARIGALTAAITDHPAFRALRDRWAALHGLVASGAAAAILPVSPRELQRDLGRGLPPEDSGLMQVMERADAIGQTPAILLLDRALGPEAEDIAILRGLAVIGESLLCPVIAEAAPALLGLEAHRDDPPDPARLHESPVFAPFRALRLDGASRFVALTVASGWALAARLAGSVAEDGWGAGAEAGPPKPAAVALARAGLASATTLPSLHRPPRLDRQDATEAAARAARLPAVVASARLLRGLRLRATKGAASAQAWLDTIPEAAGSTVTIRMQDGMAVLEARLRLALPDAPQPLPLRLAVVV